MDATHRDGNTTWTMTTDFVLQWGNRKRLRCMKILVKDGSTPERRTTVRVDRRVRRADEDYSKHVDTNSSHVDLRRASSSLPPSRRIPRNSDTWGDMKGSKNSVKGSFSPDERGGEREEKAQDKEGNSNENKSNNNNVGGGSGSSETAHDSKKGGSSSGGEANPCWLPKFVIALSNKEKEEDFMAIKGCKLPQRPKKRAKLIQRTLNLVTPGAWLCDLTLERYEVREKRISKKRSRGLKALKAVGNVDSDSD